MAAMRTPPAGRRSVARSPTEDVSGSRVAIMLMKKVQDAVQRESGGAFSRERREDRRSCPRCAFRGYTPPVRFDEMAHDRESAPRSTVGAGAPRIGTVEPLEDSRQVVGRNADPGIGDGNRESATLRR